MAVKRYYIHSYMIASGHKQAEKISCYTEARKTEAEVNHRLLGGTLEIVEVVGSVNVELVR